ncbi:MAG: sensor histidine kinase, partial [Gammaproteobacteria bacterium]|nr:sensor histidine kinase [Gammaproteobacteria bacterium]
MLPASLTRNLDRKRLRNLLALFFVALAVPTAAIVWQAYDRLKWEAWFQYRSQAEALVGRIDTAISDRVKSAESHRFGDFAFLSATAAANVQQRSPLSAFPVSAEIPGLIGYFQVGPDGGFSTPLLPSAGLSATDVGLTDEELGQRTALAADIRRILRDNRLVDGEKALSATPAEATPLRAADASLEV